MKKILINGENLTISLAHEIVENNYNIGITPKALAKVKASRNVIEKWIKNDEVIYGVTTGFGEFKDVIISLSINSNTVFIVY